jgi:predicted nucleic acid-binding protein
LTDTVVLDASTALAWCFPDEASDRADVVLLALEGQTVLVPAVWSLEIANALLVGERQKRLRQPEVLRFLTLLESLPVVEDTQTAAERVRNVLPIAREFGLSAYDGAYLELAVRRGAALATLDARLAKAARSAGVTLFSGR